jgi:hypothetical protein
MSQNNANNANAVGSYEIAERLKHLLAEYPDATKIATENISEYALLFSLPEYEGEVCKIPRGYNGPYECEFQPRSIIIPFNYEYKLDLTGTNAVTIAGMEVIVVPDVRGDFKTISFN